MGFLHHGAGPAPAAEVAEARRELSDAAVSDTLVLAEAYERLRAALLALSGTSLLRNLRIAVPGELPGVVVVAAEELDEARRALGSASGSAHAGVRARAAALRSGIEILEQQAAAIARDGHGDVESSALHAVRRLLARSSLPVAGMRHFTSVSCAGYPGPHSDVTHSHDHSHVHEHHHH